MNQNSDEGTGEIPGRARRAQDHFEAKHNLGGQQRWYSQKASRNKKWHHHLGVTIIVAGAAITLVQLWAPAPPDLPMHWTAAVSGLLGALVVIAKGVERIYDFDGTWSAYRKASEALKHERRTYINCAGPYRDLADDEAHVLFVERVERAIEEEQRAFWAGREQEKEGAG